MSALRPAAGRVLVSRKCPASYNPINCKVFGLLITTFAYDQIAVLFSGILSAGNIMN